MNPVFKGLQLKKNSIKIMVVIIIFIVSPVLFIYVAGTYFTKPAFQSLGKAPAALAAENIAIGKIHGWYHQAATQNSCVLLLHGVRANRLSMVERGIFLNAAGYSTLLIDLQAHGETKGEKITFGYLESNDVKQALAYLREVKHCSKVGAIGTSLGGAATLLGETPANLDALVLESVYPTIEQAITDRIATRLGSWIAKLTAPLLYEQIPLRLSIQLSQLHPIDAIKKVKSPVLIISGTADKHTTTTETQAFFDAAPQPKSLWLIKGAAHVDLHRYVGKEYEEQVILFLNRYLEN